MLKILSVWNCVSFKNTGKAGRRDSYVGSSEKHPQKDVFGSQKKSCGEITAGTWEQKGTQRHWGHCWGREEETELVPGTYWWWEDLWQLLLGNPTGWGHIFCRAVQSVTVLVLDWFYMGAQQLIIRNKIKWEDNSSRFQFARCTISTRHNRLPKIASFTWFSSGWYCWTQAPHLSQASSVLPFPEGLGRAVSPASAQRARCPSLWPLNLADAPDTALGWLPGFQWVPQDCELHQGAFGSQDPEHLRGDSVSPSSPSHVQRYRTEGMFFNEPVIDWSQLKSSSVWVCVYIYIYTHIYIHRDIHTYIYLQRKP